ncbi:hypothetical protein OG401_05300 [Kitasatospora purpeofusca]|uniref:hypothetical protein n=1 Tax=Kitasatospora purpeofusca TaxID=67352 RepID=UPI00224E9B85|nr:hypothetical protein [Kitasatospora purpeofusca]MCX4683730.1 hypothetical protein [Kitasatospora purpeofusca]
MPSPSTDLLAATAPASSEQLPVVDLLIALPVAAIEAGLLLLAFFLLALERWGGWEPRKPSLDRAYAIGLVSAALLSPVGACAAFLMDLPFTAAAQCVVAVCPTFVLGVAIVKSLKLKLLRFRRDHRDNA